MLLLQLGTNNWQRGEEFAPGSGILHEVHHNIFNAMEGSKSYSIYPSAVQPHGYLQDSQDKVFVQHLEHEIPVCESASPVSSLRWHSMSEAEVNEYRRNLFESTMALIDDAEKREGRPISVLIAHHTFMNTAICQEIIRERKKMGIWKTSPKLVCFVHGTGLKMYSHEQRGLEEFPLRFYPWMQETGLFSDGPESVDLCVAISAAQAEELRRIFPSFSKERIRVVPNGYDPDIFHVKPCAKREEVLRSLEPSVESFGINPSTAGMEKEFRHLLLCVGKFAAWKRLEAFLTAFKLVKGDGICAVVVGTGPGKESLRKLAFEELELENVFFVGGQPQPTLADLYTVADVGVFPSQNEPFGMVFVECMACGTPVIGANSGGPRDFVSSDVGALIEEVDEGCEGLFDANFCEGLAAAIREALDENWKLTKGEACMKLSQTEYSMRRQCEAILELLKS